MNRPNNDIFLTRGRGARARARAKIKVISEKSSSGEFREWRRGAPPPPSLHSRPSSGGWRYLVGGERRAVSNNRVGTQRFQFKSNLYDDTMLKKKKKKKMKKKKKKKRQIKIEKEKQKEKSFRTFLHSFFLTRSE